MLKQNPVLLTACKSSLGFEYGEEVFVMSIVVSLVMKMSR